MNLTYERLCEFNLVDKTEDTLITDGKIKQISDFLELKQEIEIVNQFIKESPSFPKSTRKILRGEMVSAIGATLAIEGSTIGRDEIEESFRKADLQENLERKEQEAENSRKVYRFIIELVQRNDGNFIYEEAIIKQIHKYFTKNINYLHNRPGDYRGEYPVTFGVPRKESLCRTRAEVEYAMSKFINYLNTPKPGLLISNKMIKAIMAHYYLTEIHPFGDGNGRTARALEALIFYANGINDYCFWSLANFWSAHKDQYLVHLDNIRTTCNPLEFIKWGMEGYLKEIKAIKEKVLTKVKQLMLMDYTKYLLSNKKYEDIKINQRIVDYMNVLIKTGKIEANKFQSSPEIEALFRSVSKVTRYRDFEKMIQLKLIAISEENNKVFIEPNYQKLETIVYDV